MDPNAPKIYPKVLKNHKKNPKIKKKSRSRSLNTGHTGDLKLLKKKLAPMWPKLAMLAPPWRYEVFGAQPHVKQCLSILGSTPMKKKKTPKNEKMV